MTTCCTATTRTGSPCRARPLPGRPFCLFHDPERALTLARAHRHGGAAPRRCLRPAALTHRLALFLNEARLYPDVLSLRHLQAILRLTRRWQRALQDPAVSPARRRRLAAQVDALLVASSTSDTCPTPKDPTLRPHLPQQPPDWSCTRPSATNNGMHPSPAVPRGRVARSPRRQVAPPRAGNCQPTGQRQAVYTASSHNIPSFCLIRFPSYVPPHLPGEAVKGLGR
jgi:hypothetical protein